jgi:putative membrane protein insertion efficiency factor
MATGTTERGRERAATGAAESDLTDTARPSLLARVLLLLLAVYRATAVFRQPRCRFSPTCSTYAVESVQVHGALRGSLHAVRRISRCHPWSPGGFDPVPPRK